MFIVGDIMNKLLGTLAVVGAFYVGQTDRVHKIKQYLRYDDVAVDAASYQHPARLELLVTDNKTTVRDFVTEQEYVLPPTLAPLPCPEPDPCPTSKCYTICDKMGLGPDTSDDDLSSAVQKENLNDNNASLSAFEWLSGLKDQLYR
jgi:hypothetical protein